MKTPEQDAIQQKRYALEKWNREERDRLLEAHEELRRTRNNELYEACETSVGHDFRDLPHNGFNWFNIATGEWPQSCRWCGKHKS